MKTPPWTCRKCKGGIPKKPGRPPRLCEECAPNPSKPDKERKPRRVDTGYRGEPPVDEEGGRYAGTIADLRRDLTELDGIRADIVAAIASLERVGEASR